MGDGSPLLIDGGYELRHLRYDDYDKGFIPLMSQLTAVGELPKARFAEVFDRRRKQADVYRTFVIEHTATEQLAATATLMIEAKFVHGGAQVGHVEDVVVDSGHRKKGLARELLLALAREAQRAGCYKVILDCNEDNVAFYQKCGYRSCERQMRLDLPAKGPGADEGGQGCGRKRPIAALSEA
eukprot:CAMPEP_0197911752 /NCGR_PEP_ID=MMETSP1439-20131203/73432_1 /TAXON_ID=66791 /ORGANISM="Gonyaulax spinifera, Strain CCMP409" /LENGTH=182 /DNA_ID=CAMNT_0043533501 /DNA_START=62 /DNA_END=610 /DNA_ORIENTATION=+